MRAPPEDYQSIRTDSSREKRMAPTFNRDSEKGDVSTAAVHGLIVPVQRHATHSTSATGKCADLIMNQLRGLRTLIGLSFVYNSCNLGDIETNRDGSLNILTRFFSTGLIAISLLGRKARLQMEPRRSCYR